MSKNICDNCLHGPNCDKTECCDHPKNVIPSLWEPKEECKHENNFLNRVMDFEFRVCSDCGFQWKI